MKVEFHCKPLSMVERMAYYTMAVGIGYAFFVLLPAAVKPHWLALVDLFGGEVGLYSVGLFSMHMFVLILGNLLFTALYMMKIPFFDRFRISPGLWPWEVPKNAANDEKYTLRQAQFRKLVMYSIGLTLFNNLVIALPTTYLNYGLAKRLGLSFALEDFPTPLTLLWQILAFMVIEDALFYVNHSTLHRFPLLYKYIHKLHHQYYYTIAIAAEFAHPIEFFVGNCIPFAAGPLILGAHGYTMLAWTLWRICETLDGHSGYELPFAPFRLLPFTGTASSHDAHHSCRNGNYASFFRFWDWLFDTEIPDEKVLKFQAQQLQRAAGKLETEKDD